MRGFFILEIEGLRLFLAEGALTVVFRKNLMVLEVRRDGSHVAEFSQERAPLSGVDGAAPIQHAEEERCAHLKHLFGLPTKEERRVG